MNSLLVLTPRYPYPVIGGDRLRIYQVCRALARVYRLTLLSLCEERTEMTMPLPEDGVFHRVERVFLPKWRSWLNCAIALPGSTPLQVAYYRHRGFRERAIALMREHDATLAHLIRVGDVIKDQPGTKFLELTDAISLNYERVRDKKHSTQDLRSRIFALEARRLRRYEEAIVDQFDRSFLVSEVDRQFLFEGDQKRLDRVIVCSNGVDLQMLPFQFEPAGRDIVFIGNMNSLQNLDAAQFMATEVLPSVRRQCPDAVLRLIGRIGADQAARLSTLDGVVVTGEVENVALAARGGAVGVCPLRLGAGVQNKVLEYMALGLPTASTMLGLEGLHASPGVDLFVADGAQPFADAVLRLLRDRAAAERMALGARRYVELHHSWKAMLAPLVQVVEDRMTNRESDSTLPRALLR
jgi:glycosyltransferase involved in cell wall biosynthesis